MVLDFYGSLSHYADHLAPIWLALDPAFRGSFYVPADTRLPHGLSGTQGVVVGRGRPSGPDPVCVASWADYAGVAPAPVVFVEHGAGQAYGDGNPCYSGGSGRERTVLFIVPNEVAAGRNRLAYPAVPNAVVGSPKLDRWHGSEAWSIARNRRPVVAVSFHWDYDDGPPEGRWAFPHYDETLPALVKAFPGAIGHAHPRAFHRLRWRYQQVGFDPVEDFAEVMDNADLYVCDNSSTLYEFASTGKPVVVLNAPWYRRDVDLWPRFWTHANVGLQVDDPAHLIETVAWALTDPTDARLNRRRAVAAVYGRCDGHASSRAADAIQSLLAQLTVRGDEMPEFDQPADTYTDISALDAPAHPPVPRMRAAGATDEEILEAQHQWAQMNERERWEATEMFNSLTDDELAAELESTRSGALDVNPNDAAAVPNGTVQEILDWVGDDPERRGAAVTSEQQRDRPRKALLEALDA